MSLPIKIYRLLHQRHGDQSWWPGTGEFDVIVGAILTQAVSWKNVELAVHNLQESQCTDFVALSDISLEELTSLIRPSGYYNAKAKTLKAFARYVVDNYAGRIDVFLKTPPESLRRELLSFHGIGKETADDILVYAAGYPFFIIDGYTQRIFTRIGMTPESPIADYDAWQRMIQESLPKDFTLFGEYHALIVQHAKLYCTKTRPNCGECCLLDLCNSGSLTTLNAGDDV